MSFNCTGTGVALVTPFNNDSSIDFPGLEKVVDHVIDGGVEYIVALGTTGENATLSDDEKKEVVNRIISASNKRIPVVVGIGGNDTASVLRKINALDIEGVSAILSVSPYYNKPSQRGLIEHFSAIAKVSPLPLIVYNVPGRTSSNICAETTLTLADRFQNIIAVKEASGNLNQIMQILKNKPAHFEVLSGDDVLTLPMIHLGAKGVISVIANSHPRQYSDMVRAALALDCSKANALHYKLLDLMGALFDEGSPAGVKAALKLLQVCDYHVRLPLVSASDALLKKLQGIMKEIGK